MKGLPTDVGLLMGQTAENLAHRFGITRQEMDEFSVKSHLKVVKGAGSWNPRTGWRRSRKPLRHKRQRLSLDDGVRKDASVRET